MPSISIITSWHIFQKNWVYRETFYLHSFLLLTSTSLQNIYHLITRNHYRNHHTLNTKSYLHWRGVASYIYSQLTKLLLISRNMNCPIKILIYLKQVCTFQSNQRKLEKRKSLKKPLKKIIVCFLRTFLKKLTVGYKCISLILLILIFTTTKLLHVCHVNIASFETLGNIKVSL